MMASPARRASATRDSVSMKSGAVLSIGQQPFTSEEQGRDGSSFTEIRTGHQTHQILKGIRHHLDGLRLITTEPLRIQIPREHDVNAMLHVRSEERRVGKEQRALES